MAECTAAIQDQYYNYKKRFVTHSTWFIFLLSTLANFMTIMIMGRQFLTYVSQRRLSMGGGSNRVPFILVCLAVADLLTVYTKTFFNITTYWFDYNLEEVSDFCCRTCDAINFTFGDFAVWLIPYLTFERFCMLWLPTKARLLFTIRNTVVAWTILFVFVILKNISMPFSKTIGPVVVHRNGRNMTVLQCKVDIHSVTYGFYSSSQRKWLEQITVAILPVTLVILFNTLIIIKWRKQILLRRSLQGKPKENDEMGRVELKQLPIIVATSAAFFCFLVPFFTIGVIKNSFITNECTEALYRFIFSVLEVVFYLGHSTNFFFYVVFSKSYRRMALNWLGRCFSCFGKNRIEPMISETDQETK